MSEIPRTEGKFVSCFDLSEKPKDNEASANFEALKESLKGIKAKVGEAENIQAEIDDLNEKAESSDIEYFGFMGVLEQKLKTLQNESKAEFVALLTENKTIFFDLLKSVETSPENFDNSAEVSYELLKMSEDFGSEVIEGNIEAQITLELARAVMFAEEKSGMKPNERASEGSIESENLKITEKVISILT